MISKSLAISYHDHIVGEVFGMTKNKSSQRRFCKLLIWWCILHGGVSSKGSQVGFGTIRILAARNKDYLCRILKNKVSIDSKSSSFHNDVIAYICYRIYLESPVWTRSSYAGGGPLSASSFTCTSNLIFFLPCLHVLQNI